MLNRPSPHHQLDIVAAGVDQEDNLIDAAGRQTEFWRQVVNTINEGLLVLGPDRRVVYLNHKAEALLGCQLAEVKGARCVEAIDCPRCHCTCNLFQRGALENVDITVYGHQQRRARVLRKNGRLLRDASGQVIGGVETFVEITDDVGLLRDHQPNGVAVLPRAALTADVGFHGIVSRSPRMQQLFRLIECAARSDANVLVEGESGVGKELVARAIHQLSSRRNQPYYAINCATFTGSLLLSELFGHERGAFTGAFRTTRGKLELAAAGTLLLDEVGEIPLPYQAMLLRVLEQRSFERVGGHQPIEMHARIIAATNMPLVDALRDRRFREDLYFRLKVVPIYVPPLRERREDIPLLATYFADHPTIHRSCGSIRFSEEAMQRMTTYDWPGNVRELRNTIEYLSCLGVPMIGPEHLPAELGLTSVAHRLTLPSPPTPVVTPQGLEANEEAERAAIMAALHETRYRRQEAARQLGIDRTTLWRKMKRLGIAD